MGKALMTLSPPSCSSPARQSGGRLGTLPAPHASAAGAGPPPNRYKSRVPSCFRLVFAFCFGVLAAAGVVAAALHPGVPFDGRYAYALTKLQVAAGPRPAGSAAQRAVAARLVKLLPGGHFEAVPGGLRNIVGELPGRKPAIVVAAHYDTTDVPGYLGANNSATGVGAVIALAKALKGDKPRARPGGRPVRALRRRGGADRASPTSTSRACAEAGRTPPRTRKEIREVIVLDFIALHDEQLPRDPTSDAAPVGAAARRRRRVGHARSLPEHVAGRRARRPHAVPPRRDPGDRPDRLRLPVLAEGLRRHEPGLAEEPDQGRRDRARAAPVRAPRSVSHRKANAKARTGNGSRSVGCATECAASRLALVFALLCTALLHRLRRRST